MLIRRAGLLILVLWLMSATDVRGQDSVLGGRWTMVFSAEGNDVDQQLGCTLAALDDIDGDGIPDFAIGAPRADANGMTRPGVVLVVSGADGSLLYRLDGTSQQGSFGSAMDALDDLDGDGVRDLVIGAPGVTTQGRRDRGEAVVYSGATGIEIYRYAGATAGADLGDSVAGADDLDGDGTPDFLLAAPGARPNNKKNAGSIFAYSGATGALLYQVDGTTTYRALGTQLTRCEDLDGDGLDDFLICAGGRFSCDAVEARSGATGALIRTFLPPTPLVHFASFFTSAEDWNADGHGDVLIAGPGYDTASFVDAGTVFLYSGKDGSVLQQFDGIQHLDAQGASAAPAGDLDADGVGDFWIGGSPQPLGSLSYGSVSLYSGRSGALVHRIYTEWPYTALGRQIEPIGDLDGDGLGEVLVSAPFAEPMQIRGAGAAFVYSLEPFLELESGQLSTAWGSRVEARIDFPAREAGQRYALLASAAGAGPSSLGSVTLPLTEDRLLRQMLRGWTPPIAPQAFGLLDPNGDATVLIHGAPALTVYLGRTIWLAAISHDVAGLHPRVSSVARTLTVVP